MFSMITAKSGNAYERLSGVFVMAIRPAAGVQIDLSEPFRREMGSTFAAF